MEYLEGFGEKCYQPTLRLGSQTRLYVIKTYKKILGLNDGPY